jgi:hypothetical protein
VWIQIRYFLYYDVILLAASHAHNGNALNRYTKRQRRKTAKRQPMHLMATDAAPKPRTPALERYGATCESLSTSTPDGTANPKKTKEIPPIDKTAKL